MRIISCHIEGFGKLHDVDFNFNENVNTICEVNGFGKTTLAVFIKSMFYGLGAGSRSNQKLTDRTQYQPLSGNNFGGSLVFETNKGKFRVRRVFKKSITLDEFELFDAEKNLPSKTYSSNLGEEIFGVGKETFDATIFFGQSELVSEINDNIRASLVGNISADDMASYSIAMKKLKEKKAVLRAEIKTINLEQDRRDLKECVTREDFLKNKIEAITADNELCQEEIAKLEKEKNELQDMKERLENYRSKKKALEILVDEKKIELQNIQNEIEGLQKNIEEEKRREYLEKSKKIGKKSKFLMILAIIFLIGAVGSLVGMFFDKLIFGILFAVTTLIFLVSIFFAVKLKKVPSVENSIEEERIKNLEKDEVLKNGALKDKEKDLQDLTTKFKAEFGMTEQEYLDKVAKNEQLLRSYENRKLTNTTSLKHHQNDFELAQTRRQECEDKLVDDEEEYGKLTKNFELVEKTEEFLTLASENLSKRYIEPVQKKFDEYYKNFFVDDKIVFSTNLDSLIEQTLKGDGYLSTGTLDLVNICKRFTLIDLLFEKEKPFLILDDPFINLDDKNLEVAKKIVFDEAKKYQIIFLTCHSSRLIK